MLVQVCLCALQRWQQHGHPVCFARAVPTRSRFMTTLSVSSHHAVDAPAIRPSRSAADRSCGAVPYELVGDPRVASRDELSAAAASTLHGRLGDDQLDGGGNGDILVADLAPTAFRGETQRRHPRRRPHAGRDKGERGAAVRSELRLAERRPRLVCGLTTQGRYRRGACSATRPQRRANDADDGDYRRRPRSRLVYATPETTWSTSAPATTSPTVDRAPTSSSRGRRRPIMATTSTRRLPVPISGARATC